MSESYLMWLLLRRFLIRIVLISIPFIIALWRIYSRAGRPGRYSLIPFYNILGLWGVAGENSKIKYGVILVAIWFGAAFFGIRILSMLGGLGFIFLQCWVHYSLAKSFGWNSSASVLFALSGSYLLGLFVLGFSNDKYIGYKGEAHFQSSGVDNNSIYLDNQIGFMQDEPEPIINTVNENPYSEGTPNPYNEVRPDINPIVSNGGNSMSGVNNGGINNSGENNTSGVNVADGINNINIEDFTPIGSMQRPVNDGNA